MKFFKKLNASGAAHILVPLIVVVGAGIIGSYMLIQSHADSLSDRLQVGQTLTPGQSLISPDGGMKLRFQTDGNFVLYNHNNTPVWSTSTYGKGASRVLMQSDGNLVMYSTANKPIWYTSTFTHANNYAVVQNDGNFVVYASNGKPLWNTATYGKTVDPVVAATCTITGMPAVASSVPADPVLNIKNTGSTAFQPVVEISGDSTDGSGHGQGGSTNVTLASVASGATASVHLKQYFGTGGNWYSNTSASFSASSTRPVFNCSATTHKG